MAEATTTLPDYGLPALRGTAGGESRIDPRLQPYLELGLRGAEQLFFGRQPEFFPGQTYVSPSEQTLAALQQQEALATGKQPALTAAQEAYLANLQATPSAVPMYQDIYGAAGTQPGAETFRAAATGELGVSPTRFEQLYKTAAPGVSQTISSAEAGKFQNVAMPGYADVAGGSFLTGSPYLESLIQRATRPVAEQFLEQTVPTIASQFSAAGRYGSGAMERATGRAQEAASRAIGDIATNIAAQDYARERAFQEQARAGLAGLSAQDIQTRIGAAQSAEQIRQAQLAQQAGLAGQLANIGAQGIQTRLTGATGLESAAQAAAQRRLAATGGLASTEQAARQQQLAAAGMAPQFYQQQFLPSQQLGQVGAAREIIAQQPLQEEMARFSFQQQAPYEQLRGFLSSVYGTPLGSSQYQAIPQAQTNVFGQALGGGILGSQIGRVFGTEAGTGLGSLSGTQTGAILGGLGGLLF